MKIWCYGLLLILLVFGTALSVEWGQWQSIPDGHLDGISISFSEGKTDYGKGEHQFYWQYRSSYKETVTADVEITVMGDKGARKETDHITIKPGQIIKDSGDWALCYRIAGVRITKLQSPNATPRGDKPPSGGAKEITFPGKPKSANDNKNRNSNKSKAIKPS
jgi:hypothetical protein